MILTFSNPSFVDKIQRGEKIHTIREDKKVRWFAGRQIHFWKGNPRNKGSYAFEVPAEHTDNFRPPLCTDTDFIMIWHEESDSQDPLSRIRVKLWNLGGMQARMLTEEEVKTLCKNDGLTPQEFLEWFVPTREDFFRGWIIHWSGMRYPELFTTHPKAIEQ